jgi:hypothetical protein
MGNALFLIMLAVVATPAGAADSGHCDATPFTLGKPAAPAPKAGQAQPKAKPVTVQAEPKKPAPKQKPALLSTCKDGKPKNKSG